MFAISKEISIAGAQPFPVFHDEVSVICPDGKSAFTTSGCKKKHVVTKVDFRAGEIKSFKRFALSQCGRRKRELKGVYGVYKIQLLNSKPIEIEVINEKKVQ